MIKILSQFALLVPFSLAGCGGGSGGNASTTTQTPVANQNTVTISVIQANTKAAITGTTFTLTYGDDALAAASTAPGAGSSTSFSGTHTVSLRSSLVPSSTNPVNLSFTIQAPGFLPSSKRVSIRQAGTTAIVFEAIPTAVDAQGQLTGNPIGVSGIKSTLALTAGVVAPGPAPLTRDILSVSYPGLAGPTTPSAAVHISMPVGTALGTQTATGFVPSANPAVDLFVNSFSPYATESLTQFPSGMVSVALRNEAGVLQTVPRVRVDAALTITALGTLSDHAGDFSQDISITVDVPRASLNDAGLDFTQIGQTAQVFRFDERTGNWEFAGNAAVIDLNRSASAVAMQFTVRKTGTYAILKRPASCGLDLTLVRAANDQRALNITVLTRGFVDGDEGITTSNYRNSELPDDAGAVYVTLHSGIKVGEVVLPKSAGTAACPRPASVTIN